MSTPNLKEDTQIQTNGKNWEDEIRTLFFGVKLGPVVPACSRNSLDPTHTTVIMRVIDPARVNYRY